VAGEGFEPSKAEPGDLQSLGTAQKLSSSPNSERLAHRSRRKRSVSILTPMSPRLALLHANSDAIKAIAARHKAFNVAVFGSVARREDGPGSDIDFLVTFTPDASLTDLAGLHDSLEEFLKMPVDVISLGGLKPRDGHIRQEALAL